MLDYFKSFALFLLTLMIMIIIRKKIQGRNHTTRYTAGFTGKHVVRELLLQSGYVLLYR